MDIPLWVTALIAFGLVNLCLMAASGLVYAERRVAAFIHERIGPNRVGPIGLLQPFADVLKLFMKEDIRPTAASPFLHAFAPFLMVMIAMSVIGVIPLARGVFVADVGVGVLVILALTSMSVYGVTIAGWASNSKYALLGGLRSAAQMISYELSMGAAVVSVVVIAGSLNLSTIVESQGDLFGFGWNAFKNPIGFIVFVVTAFAETNRAPFDLPEAEQELVGGYHTEYSGMKFGMFFLAEYVNMFMASVVIATLFLGGYIIPFEPLIIQVLPSLDGSIVLGLLQGFALLAKTGAVVFLFIWVRWTLPRFKFNQLMVLGWKYLLPLSLINVLVVAAAILLLS